MRVGVVGVQGGVAEHINMFKRAFIEVGIRGDVIILKEPKEMEKIDAIVIPGGESTTIGSLMMKTGLLNAVKKAVEGGIPIMGTCAGAVMMAKSIKAGKDTQPILGVMDIEVSRNYFGRQRESFEMDLMLEGMDRPFKGIFIRAPAITRTWDDARPIGMAKGVIVAAVQRKMLATVFHPELSGDPRLHTYFIKMIS
ncbi:MAG: pyridoxal 5'-phosphate synthase glutaminase subunit PdxT [Candidatus Methanodesulfokora sp.]